MNPKYGVILLAACLAASPVFAVRVTVEYEAYAATVTGTPFGMTVPRGTIVRGYLTYETNVVDSMSSDPMRGSFVLINNWDFRAEFLGRVVKGSGSATSTTNLFGNPNLRFYDGRDNAEAPLMSIDDVTSAAIGLLFSITGEAKDLPTDALPEHFTFNPPPSGATHTFRLSTDTGVAETTGGMLLQFNSFRQVPLAMQPITRNGQVMTISWSSVAGKPYGLEFSPNLTGWTRIRDDLVGGAGTTSVQDDLGLRFPDGVPASGFYRVIDRGPSE